MFNKKLGFEGIAKRLGNDMVMHSLCLFIHDLITELLDLEKDIKSAIQL